MEPAVTSLLSELEPILGISFALNLAYIGLQRFRYRETIKKHAAQKLDELSDIPTQTCETDWYKQILRLRALEKNDGSDDANTAPEKMPSEVWAHLYVALYEKHLDKKIVEGVAFICACLIFLGVAHELEHLSFTRPAFSSDYIVYWFWLVAIFAVLPVCFVGVGRFVVNGALDFVNHSIKNLKKTFQRQAQEAKIEPLPDLTGTALVDVALPK